MTRYSIPQDVGLSAEAIKQAQQAQRKKAIVNIVNLFFTFIIYIIITIVFVTPFIYLLGNSFRVNSQSIWGNLFPVSWKSFIPYDGVTLKNYIQALGLDVVSQGFGMNMSRALWISLASATCVIISSLVFNTCAAYFFARLKFPRKNILLVYVLATMMIPQQVVIVPLFLVVRSLGIINTFWALVVPWYSSPFIVFLLTQYFATLPYELDEAAIMDGANLLQILYMVVVPNSLPGLLTVSLLEFQFIWNEFYWPLVAVTNRELQPVQVHIAAQFTERDPQWGRVFSAMVLASAPIIIIFMMAQKYFFQSTAISGIKG
jgi:ABC-type glycerol-3-phosphate transport system permease component